MFVIEGLQFITSIWRKIAAIATSVREIRHEMIQPMTLFSMGGKFPLNKAQN